MKLLPEDPRLTAYALGEIEDEQERTAIESAVAQSPELQQAVAAIRDMSELLSAGFAEEPMPELSEFDKARMGQPATKSERSVVSRLLSWPVLSSAAAVLIVAFVVLPQRTAIKEDFAYQAEPRQDAVSSDETTKRYRALGVSISDELIEGTPQPIKVRSLEPAPTEAPMLVVEESVMLNGAALDSVQSNSADQSKPRLMNAEDCEVENSQVANASGQPRALAVPKPAPLPPTRFKVSRQTSKPDQSVVEGGGAAPAPPMTNRARRSVPRSQALASQDSQVMGVSTASVADSPRPEEVVVKSSSNERRGIVIDDFLSFEGFVDSSHAKTEAMLSNQIEYESFAIDQIETDWLFNFDPMLATASGAFMPSLVKKEGWNTEKYAPIEESDLRSPLVTPLSTFSIDVDTASYANVRRFLNQGQLPPADAVRIEELINYFPYSDATPTESLDEGGAPFAVHMAQTIAPWNESNHLLRVALKGYEMPWEERPASNLVFLLDVSGSMNSQNKLPLVKEAMDLLVRRLDGRDRVAVVVYAGASGLALPSTTANNRETIQHAMGNLKAGGSTNGGAGIQLAYKVAREHFIEGGNNRVILCTDGDFNVGQTNSGDLADVAEAAADEGVSLTILGFGLGNFKDEILEELSNKGKGSYAYVDSSAEARKVFLEDLTGNLFKIAKDVKIQIEFNPEKVKAYRLIGYENRRLKSEDFNNDTKRAGDIGPGHTVVALYEIVPVDVDRDVPDVDALRYQQKVESTSVPGEVATVKLRYKHPEADVSQLITRTVESDELVGFDASHEDVRFSAIVAAFGMRLCESEHVGELTYDAMESIAASSLGVDPGGHRSEFVGLIRQARELSRSDTPMSVGRRGSGEE